MTHKHLVILILAASLAGTCCAGYQVTSWLVPVKRYDVTVRENRAITRNLLADVTMEVLFKTSMNRAAIKQPSPGEKNILNRYLVVSLFIKNNTATALKLGGMQLVQDKTAILPLETGTHEKDRLLVEKSLGLNIQQFYRVISPDMPGEYNRKNSRHVAWDMNVILPGDQVVYHEIFDAGFMKARGFTVSCTLEGSGRKKVIAFEMRPKNYRLHDEGFREWHDSRPRYRYPEF